MSEPISVADAKILDLPNHDGHYAVTFQTGPHMRWRTYSPGEWVRDESLDHTGADGRKMLGYRVRPHVHRARHLPAEIAAGLVAESNRWLESNRAGDGLLGSINRMLLVQKVEEDTGPTRLATGPEDVDKLVAGLSRLVAALSKLEALADRD